MRRSVALALASVLSVTVLAAPALGGPSRRRTAAPPARAEATAALLTADHVLSGAAPGGDASMALLRLRLTMNALSPANRRHAAAILARPTDHPDFYGESYSVKAEKKCAGHICVHWVPTTRDAPPSTSWVARQLRMLNHVWSFEVRKLGYHRPVSDGTKGGGGSGRFDVYLKELYHQGLYGLTVAEQRAPYNQHLYSSYLLLDNDFKRSQYHADPMQEARVTAAHEFFHAIQYGYDATEDPWLMESTATWMEEQYDDSSNDNLRYLPWSQLQRPGTPLDTFNPSSFEQYGNWVFFEYLSEHFGRRVVRSVWTRAASFKGGGHEFSSAAVRSALRGHGGMTNVFASYASGNTVPARTYAEGHSAAYTPAPLSRSVTLTAASPRTAWTRYAVRHLASVDLRARPGTGLLGRKWRLRVQVHGPHRATMPAAVVLVVRRHHPITRALVPLSRTGRGRLVVPFGRATTKAVTVTLANTSTRFHCHTHDVYSCHGTPLAAHPAFHVRLVAFRH
jgi:hypothetical protein